MGSCIYCICLRKLLGNIRVTAFVAVFMADSNVLGGLYRLFYHCGIGNKNDSGQP